MATAIGDLVVNLAANSKPFRAGMKSAQGAASRFAGGIGRLGAKLTAFSGIAIGVAGAALGVMVKKSLGSIDATAKLSDRVGVSTEFLSSMGFAAEQTGASQEVFNKAIGDFSKRIGQAQQGLSTQKKALEALGLTTEDVANIPLEDAFALVTDRLGSMESQTQKTAIASDLFGRSGTKLINLFDGGEKGLKAFRKEADDLGVTFSRMDSAKVEEANDAMNRVKRAVGGAVTRLTIALAPMIEKVANTITEFVVPAFAGLGDMLADMGFAFANFGTSAKLALLGIVQKGLTAFPMLEKPIEQFVSFYIGHFMGLKAFFGSIIQNMIGGLMELKNFGIAVGAGISAAFAAIKSGDFSGAASAFGDAFASTLAAQENVKAPNAFEEYSKAFAKAQGAMKKKFEKSGGLTSLVDSEIGRLQKELGDRAALFSADRAAKDAEKKTKVAGAGGAGAAGAGGGAATAEAKLVSGMRAGSKESLDKILTAGLTKRKEADEQKKLQAAVNSERSLANIDGKLGSGDSIVVGAFAS